MPGSTGRLRTALADRYRIERHLGEGGMATVYLAHDVKHDRKVALKVLRPELAAVIGAERFLAEIKTTANLQHPNILPLFDSGDADGQLFYVMPYVEGETLRDRIEREKQLPVDDVVRLGAEVASALDYAHRQGVIHRDIKPENILVHEGRALVADFGIALAVSTAGGERMTETGMSVGTPHYMSPEQAMGGHEVTARSDVYALGATLYEALVGEPPFTGSTAQAIIARIVTEDPRPLRTQRKTVPAHVEGAVLTALQRLPADRFRTAAELGEALEGRGKVALSPATAGVWGGAGRRARFGVSGSMAALFGVGFLAIAGVALWGWLRPVPRPPVTRQPLAVGFLSVGLGAAIAPDGSAIVFPDTVGGARLWIKERDEPHPRPLVDLAMGGAPGPTFSPDGRWIAYADGGLKKVARDGGASVVVSDSAAMVSSAWLADGTIVFSGDGTRRLFRVAANGGPTTTVATADSLGGYYIGRVAPVPGRPEVVLACVIGTRGQPAKEVALDLETRSVHELANACGGWIVPGGDIVYYGDNGTLFAAPFDTRRLALGGAPVSVLVGVSSDPYGGADATIGADGTMLYGEGPVLRGSERAALVSVAPDGAATRLDTTWSAALPPRGVGVAVSPDGGRLAVTVADSAVGRSDIWVLRLPEGPAMRLTFKGTMNVHPAWSPDGRTVLYASDAGGGMELWTRRADGTGRAVRVVSEKRPIQEGIPSSDGRWIVYRTDTGAAGNGDILAVRTGGDGAPVALVATDAREASPALSPDGHWLAYESDISGRFEVYVVPFPDPRGGMWQVSADGGSEPAWSRDGAKLFYRNAGRMMAVDVVADSIFSPGAQHPLFLSGLFFSGVFGHTYGVTPDGRFLMLESKAGAAFLTLRDRQAILVRNWLPEMRAKLKGRG